MATGKELLTDLKIKAWIRASEGDALHDGGGLYLRRRGARFYWALRQTNPVSGARTWAALLPGLSYPEATLKQARQEADKARLLSAQGTDLVTERRAVVSRKRAEAEATEREEARRVRVRELFKRWREVELQPQLGADGKRVGRKDGGAYTEAQFTRHVFPTIGDMDAPAVRLAHLQEILDKQKAVGKLRTAAVLYGDLKQMFQFALRREIVERNPLDVLPKKSVAGNARSRERVLSPAELAALVEALPASKLTAKAQAAVWVILATGCRVGELMGAVSSSTKADRARLAEMADAADVKLGFVDLDAKTWHLPTTKNERPHTIHLSAFAVGQFETILSLGEVDERGRRVPWLFPARPDEDAWSAADRVPVDKKALAKQLADRQLDPDMKRLKGRSKAASALRMPGGKWTPHDLRRTAATVMTRLGFSGDVVDEALNHMIESRVRRTYIVDRREAEQAQAFDALGAYLQKLREPTAAA